MNNAIKDINDQLAKEQGEIVKINKNLQAYQTEIQRLQAEGQKLIKAGNMREGRISLLQEQLEAIKPKKEPVEKVNKK